MTESFEVARKLKGLPVIRVGSVVEWGFAPNTYTVIELDYLHDTMTIRLRAGFITHCISISGFDRSPADCKVLKL